MLLAVQALLPQSLGCPENTAGGDPLENSTTEEMGHFLTNGDTTGFDARLHIGRWSILDDALELGEAAEAAILVFFSCAKSWVVLFPGVGFELSLKEHLLGLTERRAAWVVKSARETADARVTHVRSFEEALGRMVFATGALELFRPFLAPLCVFLPLLDPETRSDQCQHTSLSSWDS